MTTFPVSAYCFASIQTDAYPFASVIAGRRAVTKPGSSIGANNTKPFVLKYTVWPDIGWRSPSRRTTVSGGLKIESTVSDNPAPDTIFRPAWGPLGSPHADETAKAMNDTVMSRLLIPPLPHTRHTLAWSIPGSRPRPSTNLSLPIA